jgi:hypothetical protein
MMRVMMRVAALTNPFLFSSLFPIPSSLFALPSPLSSVQELVMTEYLSNANERLQWHANGLPSDDLCVENAIIMQRFNRYPLVMVYIDYGV